MEQISITKFFRFLEINQKLAKIQDCLRETADSW